MTADKDIPKKIEQGLYIVARRTALVCAVFAVILSVLMIVNYLQTKSVDPLNSQAIAQLMLQLRDNPDDEALKEQIRALDLLARKAYFTHQWQLRTGGYLLFAFVLVFFIATKYISSLRTRLPNLLEGGAVADSWESKLLSRKSVTYGGLALFLIALVLGVASQSDLSRIGRDGSRRNAAADFPSLEEIRRNWPGFRGPQGLGVAYDADPPTEWDGATEKNILWKVTIPLPGFNSPILWEDKLFLSGADRKEQVVYCFDVDTGKKLWQSGLNDVPGSPAERPRTTEDTGFAAPTMTTDGQRVYVVFATGDIGAFDLDGERQWAKNLGMPENHYGHSSSLITYQNLLLVQFDQNTGGHLLAFDSATGDLVYDTPRDVEISWASPILADTGNRTEVILNSNPFVISYDPRSGQELWRVQCMQGEIAPSPAFSGRMVFAVNEYARLAAISLGAEPSLAWEYIDDLAEVSSPLAADNLVIMAASYGTVTCFDAQTGERFWLQEFDEGFYSSPILVNDNVYLIDMDGVTYIFKMSADYQAVGRNELGESAVTIPAFMHDRIYIRGDKNLYCIGQR